MVPILDIAFVRKVRVMRFARERRRVILWKATTSTKKLVWATNGGVRVGQQRGGPAKRRDWLEQLVRGLVDALFRVTVNDT